MSGPFTEAGGSPCAAPPRGQGTAGTRFAPTPTGGTRPREVDAAVLEQLPAEDEIDRALRMMTVADALGDLSPAHREIIVETYFKGRTAREAATELGIPAVTAAVLTADSGPAVVAVAEQFSATDPSTGAKATVGVDGKTWGSQVSLQLSGVQGPLTCRLVAVSHTGEQQTVTTWSVPAGGYDESDYRGTSLQTTGGAALQPGDIDHHFEVRVQNTGALLVAIPAHKA